MKNLDTEFWKLSVDAYFKPIPKPTQHECENCCGWGTSGGGFKSIDGSQTCTTCNGSGQVTVYPDLPEKPTIPNDFIEHMRKAYKEYFEKD